MALGTETAHAACARSSRAPSAPATGITKLSDANDAGTKSSGECTLILTEGDSAKSLAMSGLSVVGHDKWGVFPLRCARASCLWPAGGCALWAHLGACASRPLRACTAQRHSARAARLLRRRGKLLNVRDATASQISENVEIQHIKQARAPPLAPLHACIALASLGACASPPLPVPTFP